MKLTHALISTRALKLTYDLDKTFRLILYHQNSCVNFKRYNPNRFEISLKIICWHVLTPVYWNDEIVFKIILLFVLLPQIGAYLLWKLSLLLNFIIAFDRCLNNKSSQLQSVIASETLEKVGDGLISWAFSWSRFTAIGAMVEATLTTRFCHIGKQQTYN